MNISKLELFELFIRKKGVEIWLCWFQGVDNMFSFWFIYVVIVFMIGCVTWVATRKMV